MKPELSHHVLKQERDKTMVQWWLMIEMLFNSN